MTLTTDKEQVWNGIKIREIQPEMNIKEIRMYVRLDIAKDSYDLCVIDENTELHELINR